MISYDVAHDVVVTIAKNLNLIRLDQPLRLRHDICLLYTSDAADDLLCVDLGGRRIIKKKKNKKY